MTENERLTDSNKEIPSLEHNEGFWLKVYFKLKDYEAIGTIEEFKALKEKQYNCTIKNLTNECSYKETGCSDCKGYWEIRKLLEKNVAKKPRFYAHNYYCTECGNLVGNNEFEWQRFLYCDKCGQRLDWQ